MHYIVTLKQQDRAWSETAGVPLAFDTEREVIQFAQVLANTHQREVRWNRQDLGQWHYVQPTTETKPLPGLRLAELPSVKKLAVQFESLKQLLNDNASDREVRDALGDVEHALMVVQQFQIVDP